MTQHEECQDVPESPNHLVLSTEIQHLTDESIPTCKFNWHSKHNLDRNFRKLRDYE